MRPVPYAAGRVGSLVEFSTLCVRPRACQANRSAPIATNIDPIGQRCAPLQAGQPRLDPGDELPDLPLVSIVPERRHVGAGGLAPRAMARNRNASHRPKRVRARARRSAGGGTRSLPAPPPPRPRAPWQAAQFSRYSSMVSRWRAALQRTGLRIIAQGAGTHGHAMARHAAGHAPHHASPHHTRCGCGPAIRTCTRSVADPGTSASTSTPEHRAPHRAIAVFRMSVAPARRTRPLPGDGPHLPAICPVGGGTP